MTIIDITAGAWTVTDGPSREELFDSLRLFREHKLREFTFSLCVDGSMGDDGSTGDGHRHRATAEAQIEQIGIEDGSGERWLLKVQLVRFKLDGFFTDLQTDTVELYYETRARRGRVLRQVVAA